MPESGIIVITDKHWLGTWQNCLLYILTSAGEPLISKGCVGKGKRNCTIAHPRFESQSHTASGKSLNEPLSSEMHLMGLLWGSEQEWMPLAGEVGSS